MLILVNFCEDDMLPLILRPLSQRLTRQVQLDMSQSRTEQSKQADQSWAPSCKQLAVNVNPFVSIDRRADFFVHKIFENPENAVTYFLFSQILR
jgi:hypothetical protein